MWKKLGWKNGTINGPKKLLRRHFFFFFAGLENGPAQSELFRSIFRSQSELFRSKKISPPKAAKFFLTLFSWEKQVLPPNLIFSGPFSGPNLNFSGPFSGFNLNFSGPKKQVHFPSWQKKQKRRLSKRKLRLLPRPSMLMGLGNSLLLLRPC